jgi:hypothetical protein
LGECELDEKLRKMSRGRFLVVKIVKLKTDHSQLLEERTLINRNSKASRSWAVL